MTIWDFVLIVGLAVVGFLLVSFVIEVFVSKQSRPANRREADAKTSAVDSEKNPAEPAWFEVLGVSSSASNDEIKAAYRERIAQYHPDQVAGLGLELRQVAERKMRELNSAYEFALTKR
jgi:DnaJ-class molecular chaperone